MLHGKETRIRFGRLGTWVVCTFVFLFIPYGFRIELLKVLLINFTLLRFGRAKLLYLYIRILQLSLKCDHTRLLVGNG